jgi:predicted deacetylase
MDWRVWNKIEPVLVALDIRPILAVVPDNRDPILVIDRAVDDFWEKVRQWQARKWTIALHGYQHRYVNNNGGILKLAEKSEFAGLSSAEQEAKLRAGLAKFAEQGVRADAWVAPSHSFDKTTVQLLPQVGIRVISDGFSRLPFESKEGVMWVPQQLWWFRPRKQGVWTVCLHSNEFDNAVCDRFARDAKAFRPNIHSLDEVVDCWRGRAPDLRDWLQSVLMMSRFRGRALVDRYRRGIKELEAPLGQKSL